MQGFEPKEAYYTRMGDYALNYMIGEKSKDYEQRVFYFNDRGF